MNLDIHRKIDATEDHYDKQNKNKPESERQIMHIFSYMCTLDSEVCVFVCKS